MNNLKSFAPRFCVLFILASSLFWANPPEAHAFNRRCVRYYYVCANTTYTACSSQTVVLRNELSQDNAKLQSLQKELDDAKAKGEESKEVIAALTEQITALQKEIDNKNAKISKLAEQAAAAKKLLDELGPVIEKTDRFLEEQNQEIARLTDELKQLSNEDTEEIQEKTSAIHEIIGRKKQLIDELSQTPNEKDEKTDLLSVEVVEQIKKRVTAETELCEKELENTKLERENAELLKENAGLREIVKKQQTELELLQNELELWRQRCEKLKNDSAVLKQNYDELCKAVGGAKTQEEALKKIETFKSEIARIAKERDEALAMNAELEKKLGENQNALDDLQMRFVDLTQRFAVQSKEYGLYKYLTSEQLDQYIAQLDEMKKELETTTAKRNELQETSAKLKVQIEESKTFFGSLDALLSSVDRGIQDLPAMTRNHPSFLWLIGLPVLLVLALFLLALRRSGRPKHSTIQDAFDSYQNQAKF